MNCFQKELARGKVAEQKVKEHMEGRGHTVIDVSDNPSFQQVDIDFLLRDEQGETTLEVKMDNSFKHTGNLLFEEYVITPRTKKPGWLSYCAAKYLCYYDTNLNAGIVVDFEKVCSLLSRYGIKKEIEFPEEEKTNGIILLSIGIARDNNAIVYEWEGEQL